MKVELHIEELVLRGMGSGIQHEIKAAMEREIAILLGGEGVAAFLSQDRDVSQLDGGSFQVKSRATGQAMGIQLAQSVYRGIL